jgi:protein-S-isoprenylcysteine O-methyltransferase Ste14
MALRMTVADETDAMADKFKIGLLSVVSTALFLGLAVLGWGSFAAFFAHPARIAIALITVVLVVAALFTQGNLSVGEREDRANRWVLAVLLPIGLIGAYVPAWCDRTGFWIIDGDAVRWLGVALYAAGGALRLWPVFVLGRRFSGLVAIQPGHLLVTDGIYAVIRHPSYLGLLVNLLGWALAFRSVIGALTVAILVGRIRSEEALLASQFGAEYAAYRARTWRLIPGLY